PRDGGDRALAVGIGFDQARVHGKAFTTDQASFDARGHDALEHAPEDIALAEAFVAGPRECRVIRDGVLQAHLAKQAIRRVDLNLPADLPLRPDGEHIAVDEHPDHQYRVDRRPT